MKKNQNIRTIFETLTPFKAVIINDFLEDYYKDKKYCVISNLANHYILTIFGDLAKNPNIEKDYYLTLEMQKNAHSPYCLYFDKKEKIKITERIFPKSNLTILNYEELKELAISLREFHSHKTNYNIKEYSPFDIISKYRDDLKTYVLPLAKEKEITSNALKFYNQSEKVFCHNFLIKSNIILNDTAYFFNYDLVGYNDPLYDITMMLISLKVHNEEHVKYFLKCYFQNDYNEFHYNAYLAYKPLVKLTLIYTLQKLDDEYQTQQFKDLENNLIIELTM